MPAHAPRLRCDAALGNPLTNLMLFSAALLSTGGPRAWLPRAAPFSFPAQPSSRAPPARTAFARSRDSLSTQAVPSSAARGMSSYNIDHAAMADLAHGAPASLPADTIVFVLAVAPQVGLDACCCRRLHRSLSLAGQGSLSQ